MAEGGGLTADFLNRLFYQDHYLPCRLTPCNISRGHYLPRVFGGVTLLLIVQPIHFIKVTLYPAASTVLVKATIFLARFNTFVVACIKAIIPIRLF
jgi:hypothetical protein